MGEETDAPALLGAQPRSAGGAFGQARPNEAHRALARLESERADASCC